MLWQVGVTSVKSRLTTTLPATLQSLRNAGFDKPRLFIDGVFEHELPDELAKYDATCRMPLVRVAANWHLSLLELYQYQPRADRYVIFQDDVKAVKNLRQYLEGCPWPERTYLNLYTATTNWLLSRERTKNGWFKSNQLGKGALGLVFDNEGVRTLLSSRLLVDRPWDSQEGWRSVDGGISEALCRRVAHIEHECNAFPSGHSKRCIEGRYTEWCHKPSLLDHTGEYSTVDKSKGEVKFEHNPNHPIYRWHLEGFAEDFPGEGWDAVKEMGVQGFPDGTYDTIENWEKERVALERAIEEDRKRMGLEPYKREHFERVIARYQQTLKTHLTKKPG